ncbi:glutamate--tRNA ligase [Candidatus Parcubacteria bacterium]|nr:glutamate--tRNA ligase [Patescibacteria group bacterium]MCG2693798.1 glutamate--tRNA ligase [Candidatus Parcubacteria bacterium]
MSIFGPKIKVRFAPSPTGFLHIGGLRTALYNYLFAKKNKGSFILRIEDTDSKRKVEGGVENIINTLHSCELNYDEGPILNQKLKVKSQKSKIKEKGNNGSYIQSERLPIYKHYVERLIEKGTAYYCFCSAEKLEEEKKKQQAEKLPTKYGGHCIKNTKEDAEKRIKNGEKYVIRLKIPENGSTEFEDEVYGKISIKNEFIDHQVLLKSDGFPTYHLANVVDDHLMGVTHVIRGEEWLPSTPKHILLYEALGWPLPKFAHLPLLLNPDKSKLSKRQGDVAVEDYLKKGYLPEALINFVALLGWNPKGDQEIYTLKEFIRYFDLKSINKSGAVLNKEKLDWMNGEYIKAKPIKELTELCVPYLKDAGLVTKKTDKKLIEKIIKIEQGRIKTLQEITEGVEFFFKKPDYVAELLIWKKSDKKETKTILTTLLKFLETLPKGKFEEEKLEKETQRWLKKENINTGDALWPMRTALSGQKASPSPFELAWALGKAEALQRIKDAIKKL